MTIITNFTFLFLSLFDMGIKVKYYHCLTRSDEFVQITASLFSLDGLQLKKKETKCSSLGKSC